MISIRTHSIMDYGLALTFLASPYVFGFADVYFAHDVFTVLGLSVLGYSLLSESLLSLTQAVPLSMHMTFDVVAGVFVILAPWIYGYRDLLTPLQFGLHWVLGVTAFALVAFTARDAEPTARVLTPEAGLTELRQEERRRKEAA